MDTIEALRKYNRWRRGEAWHEAAGPNPQDIGEQIDAAADELERLHAELAEQCRLLGAGSEREARLLAQVEELKRGGREWQPIETAPSEGRELFVVRAFNVRVGDVLYTSDPWCVWRCRDGGFARWPHEFAPTHWCLLPSAPKALAAKGE